MTALAAEHDFDCCAPYPLPPDRDIYNREPVPARRSRQYVGPIVDRDGTTSTYAVATLVTEETS